MEVELAPRTWTIKSVSKRRMPPANGGPISMLNRAGTIMPAGEDRGIEVAADNDQMREEAGPNQPRLGAAFATEGVRVITTQLPIMTMADRPIRSPENLSVPSPKN
jgi:hypothetical protein